ncbi:MAG: cation diffusion facilitator family transporter [Bacilli bacterium]
MRQSRDIMEKVTKVLVKSLIVNVLLTLTKFVFGLIYKSKVLVADGIHSLSDLATDIVSIYGSKLSLKPADTEHPYGHGKIEYLTSIVIGAVILALALSLLGNSLNAKTTITSNMVLYVTIFTILAKYLISRYILSKGVKYKSNLLIASGKESRSDVISSAIVIVTYFLSKLSSYSKIFLYSDTIGTFIIGLIILKTAYRILKENIVSILGESEQDEEYLDKIRKIILENSEVVNIEELNIIKYGHYYQANITINMDSNVTLEDARVVSNRIKKKLINKKTRISYAKISINPYME